VKSESARALVTPNPALQRSVNSRLRRLLAPAELWRWASCKVSLDVIMGAGAVNEDTPSIVPTFGRGGTLLARSTTLWALP